MKDVPPHAVEAIERSGRAKLRATVSSRINYLALVNLKPGPMQDVRVRRAMNHAVDVDELIKQVLKGRATRMCGPLAPANVDYAPVECYKHDPARAQALFKEAGVDPDQAGAHAGHAVGPLPARQGRLAGHRRPAAAARHQDERRRQRVGNAPRQDQEPQHRRAVLPRLGPGPARPGHDAAAVPRRPDLLVVRQQQGDRRQDRPRADPASTPRPGPRPTPICRRLVHDEAPWVFLWQQHDIYGVAQHHRVDAARRREGLDVRRQDRGAIGDRHGHHRLHERVPDRLHRRRSRRGRRGRRRGRPDQGDRAQGPGRRAARPRDHARPPGQDADARASPTPTCTSAR